MDHPEIYLVRHGETEWNRSRHFQGQLDSRLTPEGEAQANAVGRLAATIFAERGPMPFYCSPLGRCRQTATRIVRQTGIDPDGIIHDDRLMELHCGHWQSWTRDGVRAHWPEELAAYTADLWNFQIPGGGENGPMLQARARAWLAELPTDGPVFAVSHGMIGRIIRGLVRGLDAEATLALETPQGVIQHLKDGAETVIGDAPAPPLYARGMV